MRKPGKQEKSKLHSSCFPCIPYCLCFGVVSIRLKRYKISNSKSQFANSKFQSQDQEFENGEIRFFPWPDSSRFSVPRKVSIAFGKMATNVTESTRSSVLSVSSVANSFPRGCRDCHELSRRQNAEKTILVLEFRHGSLPLWFNSLRISGRCSGEAQAR